MQDCSCLHGHGQPWCSIFDSFLSGCVINALKINVLCLCMIHTGASAELPLVTNHTAIHYWAVAPTSTEFRPRSCSPGISFGVDWHLQPGLPGLLAQSLTSVDDSFFSLCDPQEVFSPWISPWISLLACLCRAGTDMDVHASCQNVRTNGLRQAICYISPAKNKINNIYIYIFKINDLFPINLWQQHRNLKHSIRRTQAHWSRQQQQQQ